MKTAEHEYWVIAVDDSKGPPLVVASVGREGEVPEGEEEADQQAADQSVQIARDAAAKLHPNAEIVLARRAENAEAGLTIISQLARDVLGLAEDAGMPDSFKQTDQRIRRARVALGRET